jgi:hypothetical protein
MGGGVSACAVAMVSIEIKRLLSWEPEIRLVEALLISFVKVTMLVQ